MEYNQTEKTLEFTEIYQSIDEFLQNTNEFNNNEHINMLEFLNDMKSVKHVNIRKDYVFLEKERIELQRKL
ncbi:hypothetical protein CWI36_0210p0010 [Hamiltosporidium magnivora]|uniref:Uncharacterized protein n=1 Tax=Hamiltosporidium magnivora TaxID=148818 RepID=A0A4Q9LIA4_9MICR|nr:hypothetical protein CWI36_0210p0010 [Hamiltosporidium magnivora]